MRMKEYLKSKGPDVWGSIATRPIPPHKQYKSQSKFAAQKNAKKDNVMALEAILDGLSSLVREILGQQTSTKDLWLKLENLYQGKL